MPAARVSSGSLEMNSRPDPGREDNQAIFFYSRHPISAAIVRAKLLEARGDLDKVKPEDLFPHDQDHYGGLAANDALAAAAGMASGIRVADFCAGIGGPARYFAARFGADVTGVDLTPDRVAGGNGLTRLVGLEDRVRIVEGDVTAVPLPDDSFDAVVSQEALLHVPDRAQAIREAYRILKPGGRFAFTDLVAHAPLAPDDAVLLWEGMAILTPESIASYRRKVTDAGFRIVSEFDRTDELGAILAERLAMYRKLRREAEAAGTPAGHDAFHRSYIRLADLAAKRILGGVRLAAVK
jgi:ubiquinone/menaquinone biosynthesis C-methylase UbiE